MVALRIIRKFHAGCLLAFLIAPGTLCAESGRGQRFPLEFVAEWMSGELRELEEIRSRIVQKLGQLPPAPVEQQSDRLGYHSRFSGTADEPFWIMLDLGRPEKLDAVVLAPCNVAYGSHPGPGYGFPARFKVEIANEQDFGSPTVLADYSAADFPNPGDLPVYIPADGRSARYVRVTASRLWQRGDQYLFALSEIMALQGKRNVAMGAEVTAGNTYENPPAWRAGNATDGQSVLGSPVIVGTAPGNGFHSVEGALKPDRTGWVQVDLGQAYDLQEVRLFPARPTDFPARRGFGFPVRFLVEASNEPDFESAWVIADRSGQDFPNPAENPVSFAVNGIQARYVRVTATRWWHRHGDYVFALAEMAVYSEDENVARGGVVMSDSAFESPTWRDEFLVDGHTSQGRILEWPEWLRSLSERREALSELASVDARRERLISSVLLHGVSWAAVAVVITMLGLLVLGYRMRLKRHAEVDRLRARIASDLHDEIGSNVGSIALLSRIIQNEGGLSPESKQNVHEIQRTASQTLDSMREIVWLIHPGHDKLDELVDRLRDFSRNMLAGVDCSFEAPSEPKATRLSLDTRRDVYLIFKEVLHNIAKHARASRVRISLAEQEDRFELTIEDNGVGFDAAEIRGGHGLESLRKRVETVGGRLLIASQPGAGTRVSVTLEIA